MNEYKEENFPRPQVEDSPTILPLPFWALLLIGGFLFLQGCATTKEEEVCFVQFLGQVNGGVSVVRQLCMTPEAFAEINK
jgi:hypothetical protein